MTSRPAGRSRGERRDVSPALADDRRGGWKGCRRSGVPGRGRTGRDLAGPAAVFTPCAGPV
ncbi:hypothetical protein [Desulfovibrio sp. TomC]|uniref:hypothetical protein n=1 Tax=Desulfovibrio sp. TomC TaxID=1562888 RepID=UPI000575DE11|nr:hypothetical protein [Desulfovibrio sp. TomC]KHK02670.1 hypothetical protein NY78_2027 [Desulfovibrio sp. TomC]